MMHKGPSGHNLKGNEQNKGLRVPLLHVSGPAKGSVLTHTGLRAELAGAARTHQVVEVCSGGPVAQLCGEYVVVHSDLLHIPTGWHCLQGLDPHRAAAGGVEGPEWERCGAVRNLHIPTIRVLRLGLGLQHRKKRLTISYSSSYTKTKAD